MTVPSMTFNNLFPSNINDKQNKMRFFFGYSPKRVKKTIQPRVGVSNPLNNINKIT